jgi:hypothetical protein
MQQDLRVVGTTALNPHGSCHFLCLQGVHLLRVYDRMVQHVDFLDMLNHLDLIPRTDKHRRCSHLTTE